MAKLREQPIPPLGTTPASILEAVGDVWRRVAAGEVARAQGDLLVKIARAALVAERQHRERHEVDELRDMLLDMEYQNAVAAERQRAVQENREPRPVPRPIPGRK